MSKQIDKMYEKAIEHITPDILNNILEHEIVPMTEVDDIIRQDKTKINIKNEKRVSPIIGMIGMVVAAMFLLFIYNRQLVDTVITIDVNPSFEIQLNKKEEVKKIIAINEDAKKIIKQADISDKKLEVVIEELIVIMQDTGYLKQEAAVLVSVQNKNKDIVQSMKAKIEGKIKNICKEEQIEPVILTQSMEKDKEVEGVAEDYHISKGRAKFICNMAKEGDDWTVEQLASMTIEELVTSAQEKDVNISDILEKQEKTKKTEQSTSETEQNISKKKETEKNESDKSTDDMNEAEIDHTPAPIKNDTEKKEPKKEPKKDVTGLESNISSEYEKQETNSTKNKKQEQKEMDDKKDEKLKSNKSQDKDKSKQEKANSKTDKAANQEEEVKNSIEAEEKEEQTSDEENKTKLDEDRKEEQRSGKIETEEEQNVKGKQQKTDKKQQKEQKKIEKERGGKRK